MLQNRECWQVAQGKGNTTSNEERISAYQVLQDIESQKSILIRIDTSRNINNLAYTSFAIATGSVGGATLITAIVILLFVEWFVLRSVLFLSNKVLEIATENDVTKRIPQRGYDELANMTSCINTMLQTIDKSQQKIGEQNKSLQVLLQKTGIEEQKSRTIMNAVPDFLLTVNKTGGYIIASNNSFQHMFKFSPQEVSDTKIPFVSLFSKESTYGTYTDPEMMSELNHVSTTQGTVQVDMSTRLGVTIPIQMTCTKSKICTDDGAEVEVFVVLCRNMSEQKLYQASFVEQSKHIETLQRTLEFENMLKNESVREEFKTYCKKEMSIENMLFIEAVEAYKLLKTHERSEKASDIVKQFLSETSATQLNISKTVKDTEMFTIQHAYGQLDLFDGLEQAVRMNMINDTFARFHKLKMANKKEQVPKMQNLTQ